ncbi:hypothetical protein BIT28_24500 [Photobacterium proteolyticum]|uniref:Uncharacterized protein n=1 Tax=Photobacterium proteolyticum TaxID=1903952 RepID=A0A1Q9GCR4_9GAMM|nr:hypothetical protein BIT28_24500 [Photobacterium proteolyticum]
MCSKNRQKEVALLVKFFQGKVDLNLLVIAASIKQLDYKACIGSIAIRHEKPIDYVVDNVKTLRNNGWVRLGRYRVYSYPLKYSQRLHLTEFGINSLNQHINSYKKYKKELLINNHQL